jgi:hypothetical protein
MCVRFQACARVAVSIYAQRDHSMLSWEDKQIAGATAILSHLQVRLTNDVRRGARAH